MDFRFLFMPLLFDAHTTKSGEAGQQNYLKTEIGFWKREGKRRKNVIDLFLHKEKICANSHSKPLRSRFLLPLPTCYGKELEANSNFF
ncbi:hypothetical protein [Hugenholtzia roseola]|uniref:hypothetical protein n=1 Tax=Hugenholtzia roseola TaxID=1002 RepID=UPI000407FF87|nr:hypothetical protein [Hugenholtzia roseola]